MAKQPKNQDSGAPRVNPDRDESEGVLRQTGSGHGKDSDPPDGRNTSGTSNRPRRSL